jgi:DNA-binding MarR family transcriptional regulator
MWMEDLIRLKKELDYRALAEFRYELRRFLTLSEQAARAAGIEPQQFQALLAIKGLPAGCTATIGRLAERLQIRHHSAVELVNRLETHGVLKRTRNRKDRREVLLRLTPRAEKMMRQIALPHRTELRSSGRATLRALKIALAHATGDSSSGRNPNHASKRSKRANLSARSLHTKR